MNKEEMKERTKRFALRVMALVDSLQHTAQGRIIGKQLLRSGTSVGANYRSACRARSQPDFISKISIAEEEADESVYWMELIIESGLVPSERITDLLREGEELTAILAASAITAGKNQNKTKIKNQKSAITNRK